MTKTNNSPDDMKIAGQYTVANWREIKATITPGKPANWELAFKIFFQTRIETRYFEPIRLLQKHGENKGEGFAIVALQCSLIEFLASTRTGKSYKHNATDHERNYEFKYSSGEKVFKTFLKEIPPFKKHFEPWAECFYKQVRCGLVHEARTKGKWIIRAEPKPKNESVIHWPDKNGKIILYRNNLQKAFETYIDEYGKELTKCKCLQAAFIRKFDNLCEE